MSDRVGDNLRSQAAVQPMRAHTVHRLRGTERETEEREMEEQKNSRQESLNLELLQLL